MCNCGKGRASASRPRTYSSPTSATQSFSLVKQNGETVKFGSRLEADAQNARDGFTGIVKPVGA
jgi:hypothetical protein